MKPMILVLSLLLSISVTAVEYKNKAQVQDMTFQWSVEGQNLNVKLSAKSTGWVAVGFNPTQAMKDANFIIGSVKNGKAKATHHFGTGMFAHSKALETDYVKNVEGKREGGQTEISFSVPLKANDPKFNIDATKEIPVLLAYASDDSVKTKHGFKTKIMVNLSTGKFK